MKPRCIKCNKDHEIQNCPLGKTKIDNLKCINCDGNHIASYLGCPKLVIKTKPKYYPQKSPIDDSTIQPSNKLKTNNRSDQTPPPKSEPIANDLNPLTTKTFNHIAQELKVPIA